MKNISKISLLIVIIAFSCVELFSQPLVILSIQNRAAVDNVYYMDLYATVSGSCNGWSIQTNTILIDYNTLGLSITGYNNVSLQNIDSELSGFNITQTDFDDGIVAVNIFGMNAVNKTGSFRIGTIRLAVTNGTLNDNLTFQTSNINFEMFSGDQLTLCSSGCSCYTATNPTPRQIIPPIEISTLALSSSSYCQGANLNVPYSATGGNFNEGNVLTAQLSDANGSFSSPVNIGTSTTTNLTGSISATIPQNTVYGAGYRIRVVSSSPAVTGTDNGTNLTINNSKTLNLTLAMHGLWNNSTGVHQFALASVELRSGSSLPTSTLVSREAAYISATGTIAQNFCVPAGTYFVVVRANGYLPIATPTSVSLISSASWDFTTSSTQSAGGENAMIQLNGTGRWMIRAGDFNNSRSVTASDANIFLLSNGRNVSSAIPAP